MTDFLSITDDKLFENRKEHFDKLKHPEFLKDVSTISGEVKCEITEELKAYAASFGDLVMNIDPIY